MSSEELSLLEHRTPQVQRAIIYKRVDKALIEPILRVSPAMWSLYAQFFLQENWSLVMPHATTNYKNPSTPARISHPIFSLSYLHFLWFFVPVCTYCYLLHTDLGMELCYLDSCTGNQVSDTGAEPRIRYDSLGTPS